jgi:hypothetical protein
MAPSISPSISRIAGGWTGAWQGGVDGVLVGEAIAPFTGAAAPFVILATGLIGAAAGYWVGEHVGQKAYNLMFGD